MFEHAVEVVRGFVVLGDKAAVTVCRSVYLQQLPSQGWYRASAPHTPGLDSGGNKMQAVNNNIASFMLNISNHNPCPGPKEGYSE